MDHRFIDFDRDTTSASDAFWYRVVWLLGALQAFVLRRCVKQHVWRSFDGQVNTPRSMTDRHLFNAIRYCERGGESSTPVYLAMCSERARRRGVRT